MSSITFASRASPRYGIKYFHSSKNVKPIPVKPAPCIKKTIKDFEFLKFLNKGDTGLVYLGRDRVTNKEVAIKIIPKDKVKAADAENERRLQSLIDANGKSFLLPILASWHDESNYYIVTEFMAGGDMAFEILRCANFDEERVRVYGAELVLAIEEIRTHRIVHRDIKPSNILVDSNGRVQVSDFGIAKKFGAPKGYEELDTPDGSFSFEVDGQCDSGAFFKDVPNPVFKTNGVRGTMHYMSPERLSGKEYGLDEDLWSLGVVLYIMLTGQLPFAEDVRDHKAIRHAIEHEPVTFNHNDFISDNAKSLLFSMLAKDPRTRLSIDQIKAHEFFKNVDWNKVANQEHRAPWIPYVTPLPKRPMAKPPSAGRMYDDQKDPLPSFTYTSTKLVPEKEKPGPKPTKTIEKAKKSPFKSLVKLFKSSKNVVPVPIPESPAPVEEVVQPTVLQPFHPKTEQLAAPEVFSQGMQAASKAEVNPDAQIQMLDSIEEQLARMFQEFTPATQSSIFKTSRSPKQLYDLPALQVPPVYENAARHTAAVLHEAPKPCSTEVGVWEDAGKKEEKEGLTHDKRNLSVIPEGEPTGLGLFGVDLGDFPLPPGYTSFDSPRNSLSPPMTPPRSPTLTAYYPSPISSPTPTLIHGSSPPYSRSPSPRSPVLKKSEPANTALLSPERALYALKGEKNDRPEVHRLGRANAITRRGVHSRKRQEAKRESMAEENLRAILKELKLEGPTSKEGSPSLARTLAGQAPLKDDLEPHEVGQCYTLLENKTVAVISPEGSDLAHKEVQEQDHNRSKRTSVIAVVFDCIRKVFVAQDEGCEGTSCP